MGAPIIRFEAVSKRFGETTAVDGVTLDIQGGEVLALLGENGAGKSTLMKLLYGVHAPSAGRILIDGAPSPVAEPSDAIRHGVGMVFQHFSQLPALTVRDNLLLAWPKTPYLTGPRRAGADAVLETLRRLGPEIDPSARIADLSVGEQQLVELCKVLNIGARIVILDEPTSVLTPAETRRFYGFVRGLAAEGVTVVLITHKLADVEACADRIAVMRRGRIVDVAARGEKPISEIVAQMMGGGDGLATPPPSAPEPKVFRLHVRGLSATAPGIALKDISLTIGRGEILGVAGVAGNGQTLLAETIAGVHPMTSGDIYLDGAPIGRRQAGETRATPLGYIPEQPRRNAVVEDMTLAENLALRTLASGGPIDAAECRDLLARFSVNPPEPERAAGTLSGGNLQKLVAARELGAPRPAVLACYPTMGLDLGAAAMVYRALFAQAEAGAAVLWISEELDDLLAHAHRIAVLREGRIVAVHDNDGALSREAIGAQMTGRDAGAAAA